MTCLNQILREYYDITFGPLDGAQLGTAMFRIARWCMDHRTIDDASAKNDELCLVELIRLDTHCIVSLLRGTFHIRQLIECWPDKVNEAEIILNNRGLPAHKILRGLKKF